MEDPNSRMVRLGRDELAGMPHLSVDERLAKLEAVTLEEVQAIAADMYRGQRMIGAVGPYEEGELDQYLRSLTNPRCRRRSTSASPRTR